MLLIDAEESSQLRAKTRTFPATECVGDPAAFFIGGALGKMVDVVCDNFTALLPRIEQCIRECDFVGESA